MPGPGHGVVRIHLIFLRSVRPGTSNQPPAMVSNTSVIIRRPKKNKAKIADNLARACNLDCHANVREVSVPCCVIEREHYRIPSLDHSIGW